MSKRFRDLIIKSFLVFFALFNATFPGMAELISSLSIQTKSQVSQLQVNPVNAAIDETENEYLMDIGPVNGASGTNYVYFSVFNPSGSGRTMLIRKINLKAQAVATASGFPSMNIKRTSAASGGTLVSASDVPKKNTQSSNTVAEIRHTVGTSGVTFVGSADSRLMAFSSVANVDHLYGLKQIDYTDSGEPLVLKQGEGIALSQESNSSTNTRFRMQVEWEEVGSEPTTQNTYAIATPKIQVAATAGYSYATFLNPASSGKVAIVNKIWYGFEQCGGTAVYTNNVSLKRISAATGGTQITSTNIPKKHTSSSDSIIEFRHTNVTETEVGGADARLAMVSPCAGSTRINAFMEVVLDQNNERLVLAEGEGFTANAEGAGDVDQHFRMYVEWQEVSTGSAPSSQGEYMFAYPMVSNVAAAANTSFYTLFNPSGSGKVAVINKLGIRIDADAAANTGAFTYRRITAASAGISISSSDVMKKHTGASTSAMELRHCGSACATAITATYAGSSTSRIMSVNAPSAAELTIGHYEVSLKDNEKIVLQEGEGIGFYNEATADVDHYIKAYLEWDEEASAPSSQGEYVINLGPINGSTTSGYRYMAMRNPSGSGKVAVIKSIRIRIDNNAAANNISMSLQRLSASSSGTAISAGDIPKKHSSTSNSALDIRVSNPTVTWSGGADARLVSLMTNTAVSGGQTPPSAYANYIFTQADPLLLREGEGIGLYQEAAGDVDFRVKMLVEWDEEASAPTVDADYLLTTPPVAGNTTSGYVYSSFFNPIGSNKKYVIKKVETRVNRTAGTVVAPAYEPIVLRRTTAASSGTLASTADISKKDSAISDSTAEVRTANPTVTYSGSSDSKLVGFTAPGVVNAKGDFYANISLGDEFILLPGEGIALYQDGAIGDTFRSVRMIVQWYELNDEAVISLSVSDGIITYGNVNLGSEKTTIGLTDTQTITNNGEASIDVNIRGQNSACPWTLGSSAGSETYVHSFSINGGSSWTPLTTSYQGLFLSLTVASSDDFDLKITTPTSTSCYTEQSVDVTVQAVAS